MEEKFLSSLIENIIHYKNIDDRTISFESTITNRIRVNHPEFFDKVGRDENELHHTYNFIVELYNNCLYNQKNICSEFEKIGAIARVKNVKFANVYEEIGKVLSKGTAPSVKQVRYASHYFSKEVVNETKSLKVDIPKTPIDVLLLRKMFDWDSTAKVLTEKQRLYIADFALELKTLNSFHEKNMRSHLKILVESGFKI